MPEFYTGKVGIERHPNLLDRDLPAQHPMTAIDGLEERFAENENDKEELQAQIDNANNNLEIHKADDTNPHGVTKEQVGLENVDNTSDVDKPISTATQEALDGINSDLSEHIEDKNNPHEVKIEQIENLQDELDGARNYTDERVSAAQLANQLWLPAVQVKADLPTPENTDQTYLCRVIADTTAENNGVWQWIGGGDEWTYFSDNLDFIDEAELAQAISDHNTSETAHNNKVDKEAGKGLSSNDFTTAEKEKLANMEAGGQVNIIESIALNGDVLPIVDKAVNIEISERVLVRDEATADITLATALKNTIYRYGTLTSLTIGAFEDSNEETIVQFYSGATATVLSLPNIPKVTPIPTIVQNTWYELSVLNGILSMSQGGVN